MKPQLSSAQWIKLTNLQLATDYFGTSWHSHSSYHKQTMRVLARHGLVETRQDSEGSLLFYRLTDKGRAQLLEETEQ